MNTALRRRGRRQSAKAALDRFLGGIIRDGTFREDAKRYSCPTGAGMLARVATRSALNAR